MATIRPTDLPAAASVGAGNSIIVDNGSTVEKATPTQVVDAAIPLATQAEAEAGTDNAKRVTPLRVKQAIDALGVSSTALASTTIGEGAGLVGYKPDLVGAVGREVDSRLEEMAYARDFGATGDGVTDDMAALQAWANSGAKHLVLGDGTFNISDPFRS